MEFPPAFFPKFGGLEEATEKGQKSMKIYRKCMKIYENILKINENVLKINENVIENR